MLKPGDRAPEVVAFDQHGEPFTLSSALGAKHVVLFFYPKAETRVCTQEACSFRDHYEAFMSAEATVIGISHDPVEKQRRFAQRYQLPFRLLSDPDGTAARTFGLTKWMGLLNDRVTFVIDRTGIIRAVVQGRFRSEHHVQEALENLRQRKV